MEDGCMEQANIGANWMIQLPDQVCRTLGVRIGDTVVFINDGHRIIVENAARVAEKETKDGFETAAKELGLKSEQDVIDLIKQVRHAERNKR